MKLKHIYNKSIRGYVQMDKCSFGDLAELARVSADYIRVLFCIYQYADSENVLICDMSTIAKILNINIGTTTEAIKYLEDNCYIEVERVELDNHLDIYEYLNNSDKYKQCKDLCWNYVDDKLVWTFSDEWTYNKITVNTGTTKCSNNRISNIIIQHEGNEMYSEDNLLEAVCH